MALLVSKELLEHLDKMVQMGFLDLMDSQVQLEREENQD